MKITRNASSTSSAGEEPANFTRTVNGAAVDWLDPVSADQYSA